MCVEFHKLVSVFNLSKLFWSDAFYCPFESKHFVFFSTDGPWAVDYADELSQDDIDDAISAINDYYAQNLEDIDDATSYMERQVGKAMSNCGADPKTSLASIVDDLAINEDTFKIVGFDGPYELGLL